MGNKSVVVNYKPEQIFTTEDTPDAGYIQFTRSDNWVYITRDGKAMGMVLADQFNIVCTNLNGE